MARISKGQQLEIRNSILDVAKSYFYQDGYEKTSTRKIAKEVGIAEGTVFNYFPSKEDLFIESIKKDYFKHHPSEFQFEGSQTRISEAIASHVFSTIKFMLKLPKRILLEIFVAAMKIGKKNPERLRKLAELDFDYMKGLEAFLRSFDEKGILECKNPKQVSEIIFGIIMFELTMYLYEASVTKEMFQSNVERKVEFIIEGMVRGGSQ